MRIQVVFKTTPILVPCGDGKLTVGELIEKAIVRFKKLGNRVRVGTERCLSLWKWAGGASAAERVLHPQCTCCACGWYLCQYCVHSGLRPERTMG